MDNKKKRIIWLGLGTAATGLLAYFGWEFYRKRKALNSSVPAALPETTSNTTAVTITAGDSFPLRKGSKGYRVTQLQLALMNKYGSSILPQYGADGVFGNETAAALQQAGLSIVVDEATYNVLMQGNTLNASQVAKSLYNAAVKKNIDQVVFTLQGLKTTSDYSKVSQAFRQYRIHGVRKTLVNGLLDSFYKDSDKQRIRNEFSRMGLKYNGSQWSLSGIDDDEIITTKNCHLYKAAGQYPFTAVPKNTVLGTLESAHGEWAYFYPMGSSELLRVPNHCITIK